MNKRLAKEILELQKKTNYTYLLENDYLIYVDDENMNKIYSIIKAPGDSVYRHKFIRLNFDIPEDYPFSPPKVTFVNYDSVRIHPTMYENGDCCSTILNTWGNSKFEKWTPSMGIETILIMFHSFLDNNPYMHEPGGRDDPSYTDYVLYKSWFSCLIRYLQYEKIDIFLDFMYLYIGNNIGDISDDLNHLNNLYPPGYYYTRCFEIDDYCINYNTIINDLEYYYNYHLEYEILKSFTGQVTDTNTDTNTDTDINTNTNTNADTLTNTEVLININEKNHEECNICFDLSKNNTNLTLNCGHFFHLNCIKQHLINNDDICPMCRRELSYGDKLIIESNNKWTINPLTKRKIKINGKTYKYLIQMGIF